ncbi:retroviral-like aspartic protease family protein [Pedobacter sp. MC2016-14]|uniref:retropepsin-like aspartic protease n=1 Tax=Pedobacter sp. MC2016-14 TaxID=2897327 RepID=UPI001E488CCC|nr:retropepsin-like aspartic protease [Pedobacter sp. MC2016-14]MCD0488200.1 retroviral-like aspartic protease family protein [Pedobacter sp. MC2016-14]
MTYLKPVIAGLSFILFFIFSSGSNCFAQRTVFNKGGAERKDYYEEIPYELVNGVMFVTVEIEGLKRKFLFDTGAPVQITPELFKILKPKVDGKASTTDATGKKSSLPIVILKALKINQLSFAGIPALVSGSNLYACWQVDGVIGSNLLRNSIVQLVPGRKVIILTDMEDKLALNKKSQIALVAGEPQSYPYFKIQLGDKADLEVGFDTGARTLLSLTEKDAKQFVAKDVVELISRGYGSNRMSIFGLQAADSLSRCSVPKLSIAGCNFNNLVTETSKSSHTRIGAKLLDYGIVTLDFIHHFFYFEPVRNHIDLKEQLWPVKPIVSENKLVIGVVWDKAKGKVLAGEQIVEIDGVSCENMNLCDWLCGASEKMMLKPAVILTLKSLDGKSRQLEIFKESSH